MLRLLYLSHTILIEDPSHSEGNNLSVLGNFYFLFGSMPLDLFQLTFTKVYDLENPQTR